MNACLNARVLPSRMTVWWRTLDPAWKFALYAYLFARLALSVWATVILSFFPIVIQNVDLFGQPILAAFDMRSGARYTYSRQVGDTLVDFREIALGYVQAVQTRSIWSLSDGRPVSRYSFYETDLKPASISAEEIFPYHGVAAETNPLLSPWQRFDANNYLSIAVHGYGYFSGDIHFPPLYPVLVRLAGGSLLAALAISNLALIAALALLYKMTRELFFPNAAARTVAYLLLFPTAFFMLGAYTEPLFLLAALLALRAMERHAWLWAGFWSFCAILIRLQGIALVLPLIYALWIARSWDQKLARLAALALPGLAGAIYLVMRALVGDGSVVPMTESNLSARLALPWDNYIYGVQTLASGKFQNADVLNLLFTTIFVVALIAGWRRLPAFWSLYAAASLVVLTSRWVDTQPLNSMSRYALSLFPVLVLFGLWGQKAWFNRAVVYGSFALGLWLSAQFFQWGWVA